MSSWNGTDDPEVLEMCRWARERASTFRFLRHAWSLSRAEMAERLGPPATEYFVGVLEQGDPGKIRDKKLVPIVAAWKRLMEPSGAPEPSDGAG
jgi:hypothetical protein